MMDGWYTPLKENWYSPHDSRLERLDPKGFPPLGCKSHLSYRDILHGRSQSPFVTEMLLNLYSRERRNSGNSSCENQYTTLAVLRSGFRNMLRVGADGNEPWQMYQLLKALFNRRAKLIGRRDWSGTFSTRAHDPAPSPLSNDRRLRLGVCVLLGICVPWLGDADDNSARGRKADWGFGGDNVLADDWLDTFYSQRGDKRGLLIQPHNGAHEPPRRRSKWKLLWKLFIVVDHSCLWRIIFACPSRSNVSCQRPRTVWRTLWLQLGIWGRVFMVWEMTFAAICVCHVITKASPQVFSCNQ